MRGSEHLKDVNSVSACVFLQRFSICSALHKAQEASSCFFGRNVIAAIVNVTIQYTDYVYIYRAYTKEWCGFNSVHY
jgi:hypothetical protein